MNNLNKSIVSIFLIVVLLLSTTVVSFATFDKDPGGSHCINPMEVVINK